MLQAPLLKTAHNRTQKDPLVSQFVSFFLSSATPKNATNGLPTDCDCMKAEEKENTVSVCSTGLRYHWSEVFTGLNERMHHLKKQYAMSSPNLSLNLEPSPMMI